VVAGLIRHFWASEVSAGKFPGPGVSRGLWSSKLKMSRSQKFRFPKKGFYFFFKIVDLQNYAVPPNFVSDFDSSSPHKLAFILTFVKSPLPVEKP
jgi:hypothetical protein